MIRIAHLETNVTVACENRCIACNHFVSLQIKRFKSSMIDPADLATDLFYFGRLAHVDAWAAIGGEPTLHPALVEILRAARASGVADKIEVWTHGMNLRSMPEAFWESFDVLVVSVYPGKLSDDDLIWIQAACEWHQLELKIKDERRVPNFERLLEESPTDDAATQRKYSACFFKGYSRVLDGGYFARCCTSPFIPSLLQGRPFGSDMLRVDENLTEGMLADFLARETFMESCRKCAGLDPQNRRFVPWREVRNPAGWLRASAGL